MIYLSLPISYYNFLNNYFLKIYFSDKEKSKNELKEQIVIETFYGNMPYSYWNGDVNNNWGIDKIPLYETINDFIRSSPAPIKIDCSNILLNENDLNDIHQNVILKLADSCGNHVEFSNLSVCRYIEENYQNFFLNLSKNADLIRPFDIETINAFIDENTFYLIGLPDRLKLDENLLKKIKDKNKIEITIGNKCSCNDFNKYEQCILQEQKNQIDFSGCSKFQGCFYTQQYLNNDQIFNEIKYFKELGFNHFRIDSPPIDKIEKYNIWLNCNLIKPEYINKYYNAFYDWRKNK